jgi:hypothetical protein
MSNNANEPNYLGLDSLPMTLTAYHKVDKKWVQLSKVLNKDRTVQYYVNGKKASPAEMLLIDRTVGGNFSAKGSVFTPNKISYSVAKALKHVR